MKRSKLIVTVAAVAAVIIIAVLVNSRVYNFTGLLSTAIKTASPPAGSAPAADPNSSEQTLAQNRTEPNEIQLARGQDANEPNRPMRFGRSRRSMGGGEFARSSDRNFDPGAFRSGRFPDGNQPFGQRGGFQPGFRRDANEPAEPNENVDPNTIMEAVNLKDVQMRDIIAKIAEWTGKVIIPTDESMNQRITIYSAKKLPRPEALSLVYSALRVKGIVAEETDGIIYLKPIAEAMFGSVPVVPADQPLAAIANKSQVVQKTFKLSNYSPTNMSNIILPMIGEHGYISSDENTRTLLIIDTVDNLMRFDRIIQQFDVPGSEETVTQIFEVRNGDPSEMVQILELLIGTTSTSSQTNQRNRRSFFPRPGGPGQSSQSSSGTKPATSVVISASETPVTLVAEPKQRWIIAKGSPENLKLVGEWIEKLDRKDGVSTSYDTIPVKYADVTEVGDRINSALTQLPGTDIKTSVLVTPLRQAKQIMVFGSQEMRDMVKKLVEEIDVIPSSDVETRTFKLKYSDPDQIKTKLDELYSGTSSSTTSYYNPYSSYSRYGSSSTSTADQVKTISFPTTGEITIIASPANMERISKQIDEWDEPLDPNALKPRIIELRNTDPVQMADLLSKLFSESSSSSSSALEYLIGYRSSSSSQTQKKIVGALYGQLTFESVPGTKKIIVISKIPEAYEVVESLIQDLDKEEMAEIPEVVTLNYADPEDLAVRLNSIFAEPGVTAPIWFRQTGLSAYSMSSVSSSSSTSGTSTGQTSGNQQMTGQGDYIPPWSRATRSAQTTQTEQTPISNVIGRVRIIPDPHSKALLLLAPPELKPKLIEMIRKLDQPGKQVMIKAIILEVDHTSMTSLGMQLASDPTAFGSLTENSIVALNSLTQLDRHGSLAFPVTGAATGTGTGNLFTSDITILIDFLVKTVHAKILNQQTLWTKDNEEAVFFKGENVALQTSSSLTGTGVLQQSFEFQRVGMTLRARPSITPEKNVDMIVNVILSQLTNELVNAQPKRNEMETQTNMIVQDGQTIMLGGILFQQDSQTKRKLPLLGDIPVIGNAFQHNETQVANNELIVFITPYVIDTETSEQAQQELKESQEKLQEAMKALRESAEKVK